ncbi:MAG: PqqD family protein [Caldicoprobacterales bacterium]
MRKYRLNENYVLRNEGDTYLLCHIPTSDIFVLNEVGYLIIDALEQGMDQEEICNILQKSFDIEKDELTRDVDVYVKDFLDKKILEVLE